MLHLDQIFYFVSDFTMVFDMCRCENKILGWQVLGCPSHVGGNLYH